MGSQQLNLKWRNHHSNLLSVFDKLLCTETLSDVTLACEGVTLKAHKMILSACSPFFHNLFTEHPNNHPIVILKDVHYRDLKAVVDFMYRGEVNISQDQLPSVLQTAELLRVKGLAESTERGDQNMHHVRQTSEALKRRKRPRMPSGQSHENGSIPQFPKVMQAMDAPQGVYVPVNQPKAQFHSDSGSQSCSNWAASTETAELVEVNMNTESDIEKDSQKASDCASVNAAESQSPKETMLGALESVVKLEEPDDDDDDDNSDCPSNFSLQNKSLKDPFPHSSPSEYQLQGFKPPDQPDIDAPHELARLPRHKKKDCVVCGNRKEGMRRRSRQWCPGCNVGVHVHCFDQLVHYRRVSKTRKTDGIPSLPCITPSPPCVTPSPPSVTPSLPVITWKPQDGSE